MCPQIGSPQIYEYPIPCVGARPEIKARRQVRFCKETYGAILNALLDRADSAPVLNNINEIYKYDTKRFRALVKKCNTHRNGYGKVALPALRRCINWIRAQALQHGAMISAPNGLARASGCYFRSDAEAGEWLDFKVKEQSRPDPANGARDLHRQPATPSPTLSLPLLEALSLSDDGPAGVATPNTSGRREATTKAVRVVTITPATKAPEPTPVPGICAKCGPPGNANGRVSIP
ncbi:hypothetical protein ACHAPT_003808 [Fusarium lateritium]